MKALSNDELKKIAYDCRKATYLIEKMQIEAITAQDMMELRLHLETCDVCQIYEKQSFAITRFIKSVLNDDHQSEQGLGENFKNDLQEQIKRKLDK